MRKLAKAHGFTKIGEIYNYNHLMALAKLQGFDATTAIASNRKSYIQDIRKELNKGNAPIVFFDVDKSKGTPTLAQSKNEHGAVVTGYFEDFSKEQFFKVIHWGKEWIFNARELADSADNLLEDREPEKFYKIEGIWRQKDDVIDSRENDVATAIENRSYSKFVAANKGAVEGNFRNKIIILNRPR